VRQTIAIVPYSLRIMRIRPIGLWKIRVKILTNFTMNITHGTMVEASIWIVSNQQKPISSAGRGHLELLCYIERKKLPGSRSSVLDLARGAYNASSPLADEEPIGLDE